MSAFGQFIKQKIQSALETFFDNSATDLVSDNVQDVIEEINGVVSTSASPGFSFGRASNVNSGTWLQNETVPSNKAGRYVYITSAIVERVFVANENSSTFDVSVYYHYGDEAGLTLLGSVSVVSNTGGEFVVSWSVPTGSQLAMRVTSGAARNMVAGLELSGTN